MASPFDFFDEIYCISLPGNVTRWQKCINQFRYYNILDRVKRIHVTPPHPDITVPTLKFPRGEIGVSLSQCKALVHAAAHQAKNVLIFEDDVVFEDGCLERLAKSIQELPEDWDIFFLGGNPDRKMEEYSENLLRTKQFVCAFAYAINGPNILKLYNEVMDNISLRPYDIFTSDMSLYGKGYAVNPPICWQDEGHSFIRDAYRNYKPHLTQQWNKNSP